MSRSEDIEIQTIKELSSLKQRFAEIQHSNELDIQFAQQDYLLFSMLKPKIYPDGDVWCVLLGDNIQDGICGFGASPYLAIRDFNASFNKNLKGQTVNNKGEVL